MNRNHLTTRLGLVVITIIWGTTWAVIKIGLASIPPFKGAALRFIIAGSLLLGVALARRIPLGRAKGEPWLWLINGALSFGFSYGSVYWAEQWVPSGLTAILFATYPLFVALFAHFILPEEKLIPRAAMGFLLGFIGIALIYSENLVLLGGEGPPQAALIILCSPLSVALASVVIKKWGGAVHPLSLTSVPMLIGALLLGIVAFWFEAERPVTWNGPALASLCYLALAGSAVTFLLFYWLLQRIDATRLSLTAYLTPIIALVVGIFLMGEIGTLKTWIGSATVLLGVSLGAKRRTAKPLEARVRHVRAKNRQY